MSKRKSKDNNGNISYKGIVGDTYNFELNLNAYRNDLVATSLNNVATYIQNYGSLIPYNWTAEIGGKLWK